MKYLKKKKKTPPTQIMAYRRVVNIILMTLFSYFYTYNSVGNISYM